MKKNRSRLLILGVTFAFVACVFYLGTNSAIKNFIITNFEVEETVPTSFVPSVVDTVPILTYHKVRKVLPKDSIRIQRFIVSPEVFDEQMRYLKDNGYTVIGFDSLVDDLNGVKKLPPKPIIITLDDGYESQYQNALPILEKYNFKATFFIYTNAISVYPDYMTWDQIKSLDKSGMVIGAHSKSHPYLGLEKDTNKLKDEILGSKQILESVLGHKIEYFAYPYGSNSYVARNIVKEAGFSTAVGTKPGERQDTYDIYRLQRLNTENSLKNFKYQLAQKK